MKLYYIQKQVMKIESPYITGDMKWAYVIDIALMDAALKTFLLNKLHRKERYFITSCFLEFPLEQKATIAKRLLTAAK